MRGGDEKGGERIAQTWKSNMEDMGDGPRYVESGEEDGGGSAAFTQQRREGSVMDRGMVGGAVGGYQRHDSGFGGSRGGTAEAMRGRGKDGQWDWQALRKGVKDERGDVAYYDASFVEDPWRHLRKGDRVGG